MDIHSLEQILAANLSWNRARIKFLSRFLIALFQVQTVNLVKIASVFAGDAKAASNYKRLQRFVRFFLFLRQRWLA
jgi:phosphate starvation-inducible membrane PsiE